MNIKTLTSLVLMLVILSGCVGPAQTPTIVPQQELFQVPLDAGKYTVADNCGYGQPCVGRDPYHTGIDYWGIPQQTTVNDRQSVFPSASGYVVKIVHNDIGCDPGISGNCGDHGLGNAVIIKHMVANEVEPIYTLYAHLEKIDADLEKRFDANPEKSLCIDRSTKLGIMGASGYGEQNRWTNTVIPTPHLHLEFKISGILGNPSEVNQNLSNAKFGYVSTQPDNWGYRNPLDFIGKKSVLNCNTLPEKTSVPESRPTVELDQTDLKSALRLVNEAIRLHEISLIRPLIGEKGTTIITYGSDYDVLGFDNSDEIIPQLNNALAAGDQNCLWSDDTAEDSAELVYLGNVDWSQLSAKNEPGVNGIIFGFKKLDGSWRLLWISRVPTYAIISTSPDYSCKGNVVHPTPMPLSVRMPAGLNRYDLYSVLQWVVYSLEAGDIRIFESLTLESLKFSNYQDIYYPIGRMEFLSLLKTRLTGHPHADYYAILGNDMYIITSGWSQPWEFDRICQSGCINSGLPARSGTIVFVFTLEKGGWVLRQIPYGDVPGWWTTANREKMIKIEPELFLSSSPLTDINRHDFFSVLQWLKYSLMIGDVRIFEILCSNSLNLSGYRDNYFPINRDDFLSLLRTLLTSRPNADNFAIIGNDLYVFTSGWSQPWEINKICHAGCNQSSLAAQTGTITYVLTFVNGEWVLRRILYGEVPDWWISSNQVQLISFDTISFPQAPQQDILRSNPACKEAYPTRLQPGDFASVSFYPDLPNRVRTNYGTSNPIIGYIPTGTAVKILDGPQCGDNWVWWKVRVLNSGLIGWTAEGDKDAYWLIPCESKKNCGTR